MNDITETTRLGIGGNSPPVSIGDELRERHADLLKRADEGLYKAKAAGRDRVSWVYHPFDSEIHS